MTNGIGWHVVALAMGLSLPMAGLAQDIEQDILGNWVRTFSTDCEQNSPRNYEFPKQAEFIFDESRMWIRFTLEVQHNTPFIYEIQDDVIKVKGHSEFTVLLADALNLVLQQQLPEQCVIHSLVREEEVLRKVKLALDFKIFEKDTFYYAYTHLYPSYSEGRIFEVVETKFGSNLRKAKCPEVSIDLYLTGDGVVRNVVIIGCKDPKWNQKLEKFLIKTSGKWNMPRMYNQPLNQLLTVRL